jgi:hypothetical protein
MLNVPPIWTTDGPTEWASPPEWMRVHYLLEAERCPRSVALRYSRYATSWTKQGYPERPHVASLVGQRVHASVERIASELLKLGRRNSGESEPQKKISREGDRYLRTMMVQGAHYILEPFGEDSDLRRWGRKLSERGGKEKRAVVCGGSKVGGTAASVVGKWRGIRTTAQ